MTTTLGTHGEIGIPPELRAVDHLDTGDRFEIERVRPGRYVLSRIEPPAGSFSIETAADGLPVIRARGGVVTRALVWEIEGLAGRLGRST